MKFFFLKGILIFRFKFVCFNKLIIIDLINIKRNAEEENTQKGRSESEHIVEEASEPREIECVNKPLQEGSRERQRKRIIFQNEVRHEVAEAQKQQTRFVKRMLTTEKK